MNFAGNITVKAPQSHLWQFLITPASITACVPNLQQWQATAEPHHFLADFLLRWGQSRVLFHSEISWHDMLEPHQAHMRVIGHSAQSKFSASAQMSLEPVLKQMTQINWQVDATISGKLASFPAPFLKTAALVNVNKFFQNIRQALNAEIRA